MIQMPAILPISELRQNATAIIQTAQDTQEPIVITQRGRAAAVVIDFDSFDDLNRKFEMMKMVMQSEAEIARGETIPYDEVKAQIDAMFAG